MLAAVLNAFDGPDSITVTELPEPVPGPDEVLIEVDAAAVGPWDLQSSSGAFTAIGGTSSFPQTAGWDFSGTVLEVGDAVTGWARGARVLGFSAQPWTGIGVFAERAALPAALLTRAPEQLDAVVGATLPVAALTAAMAVRAAALGEGSRVLVIGAVGAVGGFAAQLASRRGAHVVASVSSADAQEATRLGAAQTVNREHDVAAQTLAAGGPVDAIIDLVGPAARDDAIGALAPGGQFVTSIPGPLPELAPTAGCHLLAVEPDPETLGAIAQRVADGEIVARVGRTLPLGEVREAFRLAATAGGAKTVLIP